MARCAVAAVGARCRGGTTDAQSPKARICCAAMGDLVRALLRLLAMGALVAGVVFMHHAMTAAPAEPAAVTAAQDDLNASPAHPQGAPDPAVESIAKGHGADSHSPGLLHMCLAILASAAIMLIGRLLRARTTLGWFCLPRPHERRAPIQRPPRRPAGTALLLSLCVMRT